MSNVNALKALEQPIESWLVTLKCSHLDSVAVGEWQLQYNKNDLPSFPTVEVFLFNRIAACGVGEINVGSTVEKKSFNKASSHKFQKKGYFLQGQLTK